MAKIVKSISLLMVVMACFFLKTTTAEEREGKQILLSPAPAPFPFYYYANSPLYAGVPKTSLEDDYSNDATGRTFFRIFGCPICPTCPSPVVCPTCPTCPTCPVISAQSITLAPAAGECFSTGALPTIMTITSIASCSRVTAAPKGTIDVTFSDLLRVQTVTIGIVAVSPNTQIKLTCTVIPTGGNAVAKTQVGVIAANTPVIASGFMQIIATGAGDPASAIKLTCSWESS